MTLGNLKWHTLQFLKCCVKPVENVFLRLKRKKDVLVIIYSQVMIVYARPVIEILQEDPNIRVWICFDVPENIPEEEKKEFLQAYQLRALPYGIARHISWDLILYPSHSHRYRRSVPKIYLGHGLSAGKQVMGEHFIFGKQSLDEEGGLLYQKIFKSSYFIQQEVARHFPRFTGSVRVVGSLLADEMMRRPLDKGKVFKELNFNLNRKTIIVTSSWGDDSLIQNEAESLNQAARKLAKDYNVYLTIHPNNYLEKNCLVKDWQTYFKDIHLAGVYMNPPSVSPIFFLPYADVLVADFTSFGLYFPIYRRPIIHWEKFGMRFEKVGLVPELKKAAYIIDNFSQLDKDVALAIEKFNPKLMEELGDKIFSHLGQARERYKEEIYDTLGLS